MKIIDEHYFQYIYVYIYVDYLYIIIPRFTIWSKKTDGAKLTARPPELKTLPPTSEALDMNIRRAHYQAMLWYASVGGTLPDVDPCEVVLKICCIWYIHLIILFQYGWYIDEEGNLKPTMVPDGTAMAPKAVLDITRCNCTGKNI